MTTMIDTSGRHFTCSDCGAGPMTILEAAAHAHTHEDEEGDR